MLTKSSFRTKCSSFLVKAPWPGIILVLILPLVLASTTLASGLASWDIALSQSSCHFYPNSYLQELFELYRLGCNSSLSPNFLCRWYLRSLTKHWQRATACFAWYQLEKYSTLSARVNFFVNFSVAAWVVSMVTDFTSGSLSWRLWSSLRVWGIG